MAILWPITAMTLSEYLRSTKTTYEAFAQKADLGHARNVQRYAKGLRHPRPPVARRIVEASEGMVTFEDLYSSNAEAP